MWNESERGIIWSLSDFQKPWILYGKVLLGRKPGLWRISAPKHSAFPAGPSESRAKRASPELRLSRETVQGRGVSLVPGTSSARRSHSLQRLAEDQGCDKARAGEA